MKKIPLLAMAALALSLSAAYSLEVNRDELTSTTDTVDFVNYSGPYDVINTIEEIRGIGSSLGAEIRQAPADQSARAGNARYRIIHAVDTAEAGGFDADIFILGSSSGVDHIDNLRRIISAYLSSAYGYTARDGDTLAFFITVYNAVHRGDMDFFQSKYKNVVTKELTAANAGLARVYSEWPGKTQIVIPLSDAMFSGTLSTIDTTALVEGDVIQSIREDENAPRDIRTEMTELREREGDEAQDRADQAMAEAAEARGEAARLEQEGDEAQARADQARAEEALAQAEAERLAREAEEAQRAAETARQDAEEAASLAALSPSDEEAQRAAEEAAAAAEEQEREAERLAAESEAARAQAEQSAAEAQEQEREAQALREQQEEAEQRAAEAESRAEREQELADARQEETAQERREIASETQEELDREAARRAAATAQADTDAALRIVNANEFLSEIMLVSKDDGTPMKTSSLNSIRNRTLLDTGDAYMAVAGQGTSVRLVLIDKTTIEVIKESNEAIAAESVLVASGSDYYAVVSRGGACYVARFDKDLNVQSTSTVQVQPYTAITVSEGRLFVQDTSSRIRILRATDLVDVASDADTSLNRS